MNGLLRGGEVGWEVSEEVEMFLRNVVFLFV